MDASLHGSRDAIAAIPTLPMLHELAVAESTRDRRRIRIGSDDGPRSRLDVRAGTCLVQDLHFHYSRNMDIEKAVRALAALAQDSRLEVYRQLVQAGPEGLTAGEIAAKVGVPASTLSFHCKALTHAGLIESRQKSRFVFYSASFGAMNELLAFLGENCCGGRSCAPAPAVRRRKVR